MVVTNTQHVTWQGQMQQPWQLLIWHMSFVIYRHVALISSSDSDSDNTCVDVQGCIHPSHTKSIVASSIGICCAPCVLHASHRASFTYATFALQIQQHIRTHGAVITRWAKNGWNSLLHVVFDVTRHA
jgi:hypothetical protein